jgi:hypothetical protein
VAGFHRNRIATILQTFRDHGVNFIVVGGVAAVLEGVPINTVDVDVVHSREPNNIGRMLGALESLGAVYRLRPELKPNASHLAATGHQLLTTRFGYPDVHGMIGRSRRYEDLLPISHEVELENGLRVRVLDLETRIATKEEAARDRDLAVLPVMRRTLEEKRRG